LDVKRAISQAHRKGYIRYEITEHTSYGPGEEEPDPAPLVWSPAILILLDALYKELDEATNQILDSSMNQFFRSSIAEEDYDLRKQYVKMSSLTYNRRVAEFLKAAWRGEAKRSQFSIIIKVTFQ
jgi:hypothetical protein